MSRILAKYTLVCFYKPIIYRSSIFDCIVKEQEQVCTLQKAQNSRGDLSSWVEGEMQLKNPLEERESKAMV